MFGTGACQQNMQYLPGLSFTALCVRVSDVDADVYTLIMQAQEHEFNTPLQLGNVEALEAASTAADADTYTINLQRQDIIVMASDGVLDNLWIDDMCQIVYTVLKVRRTCILQHTEPRCTGCLQRFRLWESIAQMVNIVEGPTDCRIAS